MGKHKLNELAERVRALSAPDREIDAEIHIELFGTVMASPCKVPLFKDAFRSDTAHPGPYHFTGAVEGAEMALPGPEWPEYQITRRYGTGYHASIGTGEDGVGCETAAIALTEACLLARAKPGVP